MWQQFTQRKKNVTQVKIIRTRSPPPLPTAPITISGRKKGQSARAIRHTHTERAERKIRIMNMRNLDNQMMLYFSDKSLISKLYYYILLLWMKLKQRKTRRTFLIIQTYPLNTLTQTQTEIKTIFLERMTLYTLKWKLQERVKNLPCTPNRNHTNWYTQTHTHTKNKSRKWISTKLYLISYVLVERSV